MGTCSFWTVSEGKTAREAFDSARTQAQYDHGHAGYTGTIAEKDSFVLIAPPSETDPKAYARTLMDNDDPRIDDKWGPAGCIRIAPSKFLFFGYASS